MYCFYWVNIIPGGGRRAVDDSLDPMDPAAYSDIPRYVTLHWKTCSIRLSRHYLSIIEDASVTYVTARFHEIVVIIARMVLLVPGKLLVTWLPDTGNLP